MTQFTISSAIFVIRWTLIAFMLIAAVMFLAIPLGLVVIFCWENLVDWLNAQVRP